MSNVPSLKATSGFPRGLEKTALNIMQKRRCAPSTSGCIFNIYSNVLIGYFLSHRNCGSFNEGIRADLLARRSVKHGQHIFASSQRLQRAVDPYWFRNPDTCALELQSRCALRRSRRTVFKSPIARSLGTHGLQLGLTSFLPNDSHTLAYVCCYSFPSIA